MSGHGGIGRRVTLRSLWAKPVKVQVLLAAPDKAFFVSDGVDSDLIFYFFFKLQEEVKVHV